MDTVVVIEIYVSLYRGNRFTVRLVQVVVDFFFLESTEKPFNMSIVFWCGIGRIQKSYVTSVQFLNKFMASWLAAIIYLQY